MKKSKEFQKLCTPAKIYFVITLFFCVMSLINNIPFFAVLIKLFFALIWTYILSWLCKKGFTWVSWFLVLLPFIIILLGMVGLIHLAKKQQNQQDEIMMQHHKQMMMQQHKQMQNNQTV